MARWAATACAASVLVSAVAARAQFLPPDQSLIQFNRYGAAGQRPLPGYDERGVPIGDLLLRPAIDVSANYNDNVFAIDTPRRAAIYAEVAPSLSLQSNWTRDSLNLSADATLDRYTHDVTENRNAVDVSAYGIKEFGDSTRVRLLTRFQEDRESRESQNVFTLTQRPILFNQATVGAGVTQTFSNFQLQGEAGYARYHFFNALLPDGTVFDQGYRNAGQLHLQARAEYAQTPGLGYFLQLSHDATSYDQASIIGTARNSRTTQALGGVRFELPVLARGEVGVGYLYSDYNDVRFRSFGGLAISSRVSFFPTQLTTVTVDAIRQVNDAGLPNSSGYVVLRGGVQVDHELLRQLLVSGQIHVEGDTYNGIDRHDRRIEGGAGAEYRLRNGWRVRLAYDVLDLSSTGVDRYKSFARNRLTLGLRYAV